MGLTCFGKRIVCPECQSWDIECVGLPAPDGITVCQCKVCSDIFTIDIHSRRDEALKENKMVKRYNAIAHLINGENVIVTCSDGTPWIIEAVNHTTAYETLMEESRAIQKEFYEQVKSLTLREIPS